jgi:hypothetical protein
MRDKGCERRSAFMAVRDKAMCMQVTEVASRHHVYRVAQKNDKSDGIIFG